ncbi:Uncharacterized protein OBRU01_05244 [Operophtera brumata]|uniref:Uncharacterized protein n=1 Tax=Operophtera brumata TaxID=104452 RepID=A0A0L7LNC0_OPEBR|nr:Uncharacterized protein OBRU01_05244 [Operophtera brumata]
MCGRKLRTKLDALRPDRNAKVRNAQSRQKNYGASGSRELSLGEEVWLRQYRGGDRWMPGKVAEKIGVTDYRVVDAVGRELHKHIDQLKHRKRSSLICPSSPSHSKEFTKQVAGEGGKPSPRGSGEFPSEVVIVEGDKDAQDQFEDCVEQNIPELKQAPLLPSPEPIQPRHVRQCRLDKPPNYKV